MIGQDHSKNDKIQLRWLEKLQRLKNTNSRHRKNCKISTSILNYENYITKMCSKKKKKNQREKNKV